MTRKTQLLGLIVALSTAMFVPRLLGELGELGAAQRHLIRVHSDRRAADRVRLGEVLERAALARRIGMGDVPAPDDVLVGADEDWWVVIPRDTPPA